MPNWCEGQLKIRGTFEALKSFIKFGFEPCSYPKAKEKFPKAKISENSIYMDCAGETLYFKGTRRHFCETDYIEMDVDNPEEVTVLVVPLKAAWSIIAENLQRLCKEFNVDMKIQGFEKGMQFSQLIEIVNGEIIEDKEIKYDDWYWDCPCPDTGG